MSFASTPLVRAILPALQHTALAFALMFTALQVPMAFASDSSTQLRAMMNKIITQNNLNIPASVVNTSEVKKSSVVNAYTDGSKVIMTTALWDKLKTDDAKAFVIGHEIGHITNSHISRGTARKTGFMILARIASVAINNPIGSLAAQYGVQLVDLKFDRGQEYQADDSGIQYIMKSGYNKNASIDVFRVLKAEAGSGRSVEFLQTHPLADSRIHALTDKYDLKPM
jgi:predicted Zn-dependent protease